MFKSLEIQTETRWTVKCTWRFSDFLSSRWLESVLFFLDIQILSFLCQFLQPKQLSLSIVDLNCLLRYVYVSWIYSTRCWNLLARLLQTFPGFRFRKSLQFNVNRFFMSLCLSSTNRDPLEQWMQCCFRGPHRRKLLWRGAGWSSYCMFASKTEKSEESWWSGTSP